MMKQFALIAMTALAVVAPGRSSGIRAIRAVSRDSERVAHMEVDRVVTALHLQPGQTVADLGSGSGSSRARWPGRRAGGHAFAIDIDAALLAIVQRSAERSKITNITLVEAAPTTRSSVSRRSHLHL
jgi:precorrin-6B methylase 2